MAIGPQLAGIQANDGTLLREGQVRKTAPQELTFHFNDAADLDAVTASTGIRLTRSGGDDIFERAVATTDFNTSGQTVMDFTAVAAGESGNGITLVFIKNNLGTGVAPKITVLGETINVELNSTTGSRTTASQLRDAINNHVTARQLVTASLRSSSTGNVDIAAPAITYSPLVTGGANAASVTTNLNAGSTLLVKLTAVQSGPAGNGISVIINRVSFGGVSPPQVTVNDRTITVTVNSNSVSPTTAQEFVDALNNHSVARTLLTAQVVVGNPQTAIGNRVNSGTTLRLSGTRDIPVEPGFVGLGSSTREIVMRFKEPLPDDIYHVEVLGTGSLSLRNVDGGAFGDTTEDGVDNGADFNLTFTLNLGPQILSVVPQPVTRNTVTNTLSQALNQIHVYFNEDDLWPVPVLTGELATNPTVVDPAFYQLIFTKDSIQNSDDVIYRPKTIQYNPTSNVAVLQFEKDLHLLGSGTGTFRLRIGTDESIPVAPITTALSAYGQSSTDFNSRGAATVLFQQVAATATPVTIEIKKSDRGVGAGPAVTLNGTAITIELNSRAGSETTASQVVSAVNSTTSVGALVSASLFNTPAPGNVNVTTSLTSNIVLTLREVGSSFDTALNVSVLSNEGQILSSAITAQPYDLPFPGAISEPGHRDLAPEVQQHYLTGDDGDLTSGITVAHYNFQDLYGFDPLGNALHNAITESQKQRAREIFSLYSEHLGIQFIETENLGMTIATGDLRAVDPQVTTGPGGVLGIAGGGLIGVAVMDLQDFSSPGADIFGGSWFLTAMHEIGHLLGLGHTDELAPLTVMNDQLQLLFPENTLEPIFPGDHDIVHGQFLYRPDGKDIDLYKFELRDSGKLTAETFAERRTATSLLDTVLTVYRQESSGQKTLIARNDDYFTNDSFVELDLSPGVYWIGVSASGNDQYDPVIEDTGLGGRSEGEYELRLNFRPDADRSILDSTGVELDGNGDGVPGGVFNFWFKVQDSSHTIFVDKAASFDGTGSIGAPYQLISSALAAARSGDIIRIQGNGGTDRNLATLEDNLAYEIGFNRLGSVLADGATFDVPQGVTVMVDAGAIIKSRRARIGVGSSSELINRSGGAFQVLGTPIMLDVFGLVVKDTDGNAVPASVYFTSIHDGEIGLDKNPDTQPPDAAPGDWGGIEFHRAIDAKDANRQDHERSGIFLNHISQADFRYGGGSVIVDGLLQVVSPVTMVGARPTVMFNRISSSADAAMAASPDSFQESNFHDPSSQLTAFTADYTRVGPEIYGNLAVDNSINGLFVNVLTPAGNALQPMTVSGRWNDTDIPHVLAERLVIQGTPGGPVLASTTPSVQIVTLEAVSGGVLPTGTFHYRVVFVDASGNESAASNPTSSIDIDGLSAVRAVQLENLPQVPAGFVSKRLYRSDRTQNTSQFYQLVAELNAVSTTYQDEGASLGRQLIIDTNAASEALRARFDARLSIDPGVIVKLNGGAIETTLGAAFYAEGIAGREVVFTSSNDDRYGAGGTFDSTDNGSTQPAQGGDWGGIHLGAGTRASIDHAVFAYGGGSVSLEGGFGSFNTLEIRQSAARVAHSLFENNASGVATPFLSDRVGRGFNRDATIFVRGAQPVLVGNTMIGNDGAAISINASALNAVSRPDHGRSTFDKAPKTDPIDVIDEGRGNQGPLVRLNQLTNNDVNGMQVRGGSLTTESVWDDTDIVHVLRNETVYVPDFHTFGGLRLESSNSESLVVKIEGSNGGITATGRPLDINDRIGGSVHVLGKPGHPVILTSINDCTVGAGFTPDGIPQSDTINSRLCRLTGAGGNSGAVVIDGGDRDDHGFVSPGPDGQNGTRDDINNQGWLFIQQMIDYAVKGTRNEAPKDVLAIGAKLSGFPGFPGALDAVQSASVVLGLTVETAVGNQISTVNFNDYKVLYIPSTENNISGGISQSEIDLLTARKVDIQNFVNTGGSLVALTEAESTTPYSWLELPLPFTITDFTAGGIIFPLRKTQAAIDAGFTISDQDLTLGTPYHNDFTGPPGFNGLVPFVLDTGDDNIAGNADDRVITLGLASGSFGIGVNPGQPGDWRSIQFGSYSNDRNVAITIEDEGATSTGAGNGSPSLAQFLGTLAPREKAGDENQRLGFSVQGHLSPGGDADVYSFKGTAGSEVWLDIDRTGNSLDTVLELIDSNGTVLARSNDSGAEAANPSLLFRSSSLIAGTVNPLRKAGYDPSNPGRNSAFEINDQNTTNPRDAGMRVVLPGTPGATTTYHVRVRSNSSDLNQLNGGLTSGNYELQVRLREQNEVPGSTIRYSDVRFAVNGIEVLGQPIHSPLLGEGVEIETGSTGTTNNNSQGTAQPVGNLLQTDRGTLSVRGNLDLATDLDFFQVTVEYDAIQGAGPNMHASTIFDIDYADGLGRPNTTLWVFDSEGRLILRGTGSNVAEDRPGPLAGSDMTDLSRGSVGSLDPYIGPVMLPAGPDRLDLNGAPPEREIYYVAVTSNAMTADVMRQYLEENVPADVASVRLEPVNSVRRIAEDRIGFSGSSGIVDSPHVPVLIDPQKSFVPFHLGDVTLFVSQDGGLAPNTISTLRTVDPFTGSPEVISGSFAQPIADIAMRGDGNIHAFTIGPNNFNGAINDASTGTYIQIDSATGATTALADDGVEMYVNDPMNAGNAVRPNNNAGFGITYNALTYQSASDFRLNGYAVGSRNDSFDNDPDFDFGAGVDYLENILYNFDINTGAVVNTPSGAQDRQQAALLTGAGTQKIEVGEILTYTRFIPQLPETGDTFTITINGKSISYTAGGGFGFASAAEVVGGLAGAWQTAALSVPEFAAFEVLNDSGFGGFGFGPGELRVRLIDPNAAHFDITTSTANGGFIFEELTMEGFGPGGTVTGITSLNGTFYAVTDRGGLYEVNLFGTFNPSSSFFFFSNNLATYVRNSAVDLMTGENGQPIRFAGLTRGPEDVEGGKYADMLFGITDTGRLYAFDTNGVLQPIFVNNRTSVDTGLFNVNGLAFSTLDRNLWTVTSNRGDDLGHGLQLSTSSSTPFDGSRLDTQRGGSSIYFGNDQSTSQGGNQSFSNTAFVRDYNFPGGAYGTVVSNPFNLSGYAAEDLPVLYFNYFLDTEGTDYNPNTNPVTPTRDTLRVFASADDGEWTLLATNNTFQDAARSDEFDIGQNDLLCTHPAFATEPCVQKLWDNTGRWRQARIPLNALAGKANVRLRFDFSSAGDMNLGDTFTVGSELRAVSGSEVRDGQTITLNNTNTLEIDMGYTLVAPNGTALRDGNAFTIVNAQGVSKIFEFDSDGFFNRNIAAVAGSMLRDGETFQLRVGSVTRTFEFDSGISLHVPTSGGNTGGLRDGDTFSIDGVEFEFDTDGNFADGNAVINLIVDAAIQIPTAGGGIGGLQDGNRIVINNGLGGPDVIFEFDRDRPPLVAAGTRAIDITNLELHVPIAGGGFGGVSDGHSFAVNDGFGGPDILFEFDKNNSVASGNRAVPITDQSTQDEVANAIVIALQLSGLGLRPVNQGGGVVRLGVFRHSVDTTTAPSLTSRVIDATQDEIAERLADSILNSGLGLTPSFAGSGLIELGSTVHQVDTSAAPTVQYRLLAGSQDEVASLIVDAIRNTALGATPLNLGNGEVFLGRQVNLVDTSGAPSMSRSGAAGTSTTGAVAVLFTPQDTATIVAANISAAINGAGLGITTSADLGVVLLPSSVAFSPSATALTPQGVHAIRFSAQDSPATVAQNIDTAINTAFASPSLTADLGLESNDTLAQAIDAGFAGGPVNFQASGFIGDNAFFGFQRGVDVDYVKLELKAGDRVFIDVDAPSTSTLSPALRLFNDKGEELASTRPIPVTQTFFGFTFTNFLVPQSSIDFHAVTTGTYYVAVSSTSNFDYHPNFEGSADVTLGVPVEGGAIGGLTDGESFSITDGVGGAPVVFEFDSNGQTSLNVTPIRLNDLLMQLPGAGAGAGGIQDGNAFIVDDNRGTRVRFEFDSNFNSSPGSVPIFIFPGFDTAASIAFRIEAALINANLGLTPVALSNGSLRLGTTTHTVDSSGTPTMTLSTIPRTQQDIAIQIRDAIRNSPLALRPTLGTQGDITLDVRSHRVDTTLAPNLTFLSPSNTGAYDLSITVDNPFDTQRDGNRINLIGANTVTTSGLSSTFLDGRPGVSQSNRTAININSSMTRADVAKAIADGIGRSTAGYVQQIIAPAGIDVRDGEIFAIGDGTTTVNFEFDSGYSLQLPDLTVDPNAYLDGEFFTIAVSGSATTFEFDNNGITGGGSIGVRFNDIVLQVPTFGVGGGGIADGNTIAVDQGLGTPPVNFEFDTDGVISPNNLSIRINANATQNDIANAIVVAFNSANVGLSAVNRGQGVVQLGITTQTVDITNTPSMTQRFVLLTQQEMADKVAKAIGDAGIGMTPQNLGNGLIHLGGTASHTVNVSNALYLQLIGAPGPNDPAALVIPVFPSSVTSAAQVAQLIQSAINTAVATRGLRVTAVPSGARRINLLGAGLTTEFSNAPSLELNNAGESVKTYDNIVKVIGHSVTNRGPFGLENSLAGDAFGAFNTGGTPNVTNYPGALRGMNNAREGAYIDDIVIGFAERGEMITGAQPNASFVPNSELLSTSLQVGVVPHNEIHVGPYQLEMRRGENFGFTFQDPIPEIFLINSFDSNDRLSQQVSLDAPAGYTIVDGQTLIVGDGLKTVTFEFEDLDLNNGIASGRVSIGYRASDTAATIARRVRDAVNSTQVQSLLKITAALSDGNSTGTTSTSNRVNFFGNAVISLQTSTQTRDATVTEPSDTLLEAISTGIGVANTVLFTGTGEIGDNVSLSEPSSDVDLFSVNLNIGERISVDVTAIATTSFLDGILRIFDSNGVELTFNDDTNGLNPHIDFVAPASGTYYIGVSGYFNFFYNPQVAGSGSAIFGGAVFSTGEYVITVEKSSNSFNVREFDFTGDRNLERDQGQIIIESNRFYRSRDFGVLADSGARDGAGLTPHQGPTRLTRELNVANLVPGVTIANNLIAKSGLGGIRFSGEVNSTTGGLAAQTAPIPFGRIYNNTIVSTNIGIQVDENASPTLLNNVLSGLTLGISVDASSSTTVVGGTLYHRVLTRTQGTSDGTFPLILADSDALFVNSNVDNYYLAPGSLAIDSSVNSVQDRPEMIAIKSPLDIALSPILAPDLDALGQTRVDDPTVNTPPGLGSNVFKDRGAIDRADFSGPTAVLLNPPDNDSQGRDRNAQATYVELTNEILTNFSIQLVDGLAPTDAREGSGADDTTVQDKRVTLFRDGEELVQGLDYIFQYDTTNNIIRLTPLAGIWEPDRIYDIQLSNSRGTAIQVPDGTGVSDGDSFQVTDVAGNQVTFEFDSGFVLRVPQTLALQVPTNGGAAILDGETFTITDGVVTETFEFDNNSANGNTANPPASPPVIVISFTSTDTANDIANKIVAAISSSSLDLSPVNIINSLGRAVHLGSTSVHSVDTSNTTMTQSGQAGGIEDGQTFTIDDGTKVVTFEFVEGTAPADTATNRYISFTLGQTNEQIADSIVSEIKSASVNLNPSHQQNSDGLVHLGGTTRHLVNVTTSTLVLTGKPGVQPAWSLQIPTVGGKPDYNVILDGQTFILGNGTTTATFELDSNGQTTAGNRVITFNTNTTADQLANALAIAIRNANLGLSPVNAGGGVITLVGTTSHTIDVTASALVVLGSPGRPASEPVSFIPGDFYTPNVPVRSPIFTTEQMAVAIAAAIQNARAKLLLDEDVSATVRDDEVLVDGVVDISGIVTIFRSNITDVAGNSLKPNRSDGTTAFTIFIGSGLDYGDAPSPYPTLDSADGARHQIVGDFYLGSGVDIDFDGQPNSSATGDDLNSIDDEDGVTITQTFTGGYGGAIAVTASAAGVLDAWVDFNRDGDWNDSGEQIFVSKALVAGRNDLTVNVPGTASPGQTFGRFRFSSRGGLGPTGFADDGEVEDHAITIVSNPWRNPVNGLDVDNSGFVVPLDALTLINDLNRNGPRQLPNPPVAPFLPPPYLDVNGDGFATALDVLSVINYLNSVSGSAEGEGRSAWEDSVANSNGQAAGAAFSAAEGESSPTDDLSYIVSLNAIAGLDGWLNTVDVVDHRLNLDDGEEQELLAALDEFGMPDEALIHTFAASTLSDTEDSDPLADLFASGVDELFDSLDDFTTA